ncbi:MAG TPA: serine hydrolase domain-containing protein [Pseudolabrys sp.]|nr:serine hydrolase domain-containing protein [Pseudolabrys sp.]
MASDLPRANKPEDVGLSSARLKRLTDTLRMDIDKAVAPGAVLLIARRGKIACLEALGYRDRESGAVMAVDTIFRVASMTKPLTSVAAMMLAEEGKLLIADPVANYIPHFANLKVAVDSDNPAAKKLAKEPLRRQMTVQDLLRHTSGLTYAHLTGPLLKEAYETAKVADEKQTNADLVARLADVPLAYQPGSTWQYGLSTDVLGRVVEVASGIDLDRFILDRICKPLGMSDSSFGPIDAARAAQPQIDPASGKRPPMRDTGARPNWISGGSGLLSTAGDYARFAQMLLNGGELGGACRLSPATVALMTSDHLTPETRRSPSTPILFGALAPTAELGLGFGLGFAVRTHAGRNPLPGSVGDFSWTGVTGTYFWVDPKQELIAILMTQAPAQRLHYRYMMRTMVYAAIAE